MRTVCTMYCTIYLPYANLCVYGWYPGGTRGWPGCARKWAAFTFDSWQQLLPLPETRGSVKDAARARKMSTATNFFGLVGLLLIKAEDRRLSLVYLHNLVHYILYSTCIQIRLYM